MGTNIFVNLPVASLDRSVDFFIRLGFSFNPDFTDDTATCMIVDDNIHVMLLTHDTFRQFTPKAVCDTNTSTEVLVCLSMDSREQVDALVGEAVAAGGITHKEPKDHDFMYGHGFQDPDSHIRELIHMDMSAMETSA